MTRRLLPALLVALFVSAACAQQDQRAGAASPAKKSEAIGGEDTSTLGVPPPQRDERRAPPLAPTDSPVTASTTGTAQPTPAPSPAGEPPDSTRRREVALRSARSEVEQAQRELEVSMSDCRNACRALGSMERATGHLCDLATEHDDRRRCEDAKTSVLRAREKIRATCGSCPGGPSLEKSAPIPSRP